jgi:hypothetical protein
MKGGDLLSCDAREGGGGGGRKGFSGRTDERSVGSSRDGTAQQSSKFDPPSLLIRDNYHHKLQRRPGYFTNNQPYQVTSRRFILEP